MSKKLVKKTTGPLSPKPGVTQPRSVYPAKQRDSDQQQGRFTKTAAGAAGALKTSAPAVRVEFSSPTTTVPSKPLASLQPTSVPRRADANSIQRPMPQKGPVTALAPKASPAAATPSPKPLTQSAPRTSPQESALAGPTPKPTAAKAFKVTFALFEPNAKHVSLCGEFNGWASDATPMKRDNGGNWETTVALPPGRYEYKFIVDGQWITDPQARESVWNQHGTLNSVVQVWA